MPIYLHASFNLAYSRPQPDSYSYGYRYGYIHSYCNRYRDFHAYGNCHCDSNSDCRANTDADTNPNADCNSNGHGHGNVDPGRYAWWIVDQRNHNIRQPDHRQPAGATIY